MVGFPDCRARWRLPADSANSGKGWWWELQLPPTLKLRNGLEKKDFWKWSVAIYIKFKHADSAHPGEGWWWELQKTPTLAGTLEKKKKSRYKTWEMVSCYVKFEHRAGVYKMTFLIKNS